MCIKYVIESMYILCIYVHIFECCIMYIIMCVCMYVCFSIHGPGYTYTFANDYPLNKVNNAEDVERFKVFLAF